MHIQFTLERYQLLYRSLQAYRDEITVALAIRPTPEDQREFVEVCKTISEIEAVLEPKPELVGATAS